MGVVHQVLTVVATAGASAELEAAEGAESANGIDPNKLNHIFGEAEHNLDTLASEFGSQESAYNALQQATQTAVRNQGLNGVFETTVQVGSETVTVTGKVIDGVARIGTAYKP